MATIPVISGWRVFRSDAGRLWASRERPFNSEEARRTVDADTEDELRAAVSTQEEQEQRAMVS
ncbi:hypothetical protein ABZ470_26210 [Streptosporangium sp. NPDC020072]|uniref:hypothetical protein n=1 Tax=Streptosporangium sp. NPDC020072 TaxID=3154788 RepID=UPI00343F5BE1